MLHEHMEEVESRAWGKAKTIACDPAGNGRNDQTAESNVSFFRRRGILGAVEGFADRRWDQMIRFALRPAAGEPRLSSIDVQEADRGDAGVSLCGGRERGACEGWD